MSPEIINGFEFDLPTDVFSLGIIFTEILSRRLVDSKTFIVRLILDKAYNVETSTFLRP